MSSPRTPAPRFFFFLWKRELDISVLYINTEGFITWQSNCSKAVLSFSSQGKTVINERAPHSAWHSAGPLKITLDFALNWPFQTASQASLLPGPDWGWSQELYSCKWSHKLFQAPGGKKSLLGNKYSSSSLWRVAVRGWGAPLWLSWEKWVNGRDQSRSPVLLEQPLEPFSPIHVFPPHPRSNT